jgi:hypothetical protein
LPRIVAVGKSVYVAWQSFNQQGIFFVRSIDGGASFGNTINLNNDASNSFSPVAAAYGDNHVYIAWTSWTEDEIFYKRSVNGGTVFGNTINLSNDSGNHVMS